MPDATANCDDRYAQLAGDFRAHLPMKVQELDRLFESAAAGSIDPLRDALQIVRRISSAGTVYGLTALQVAADELADTLESDIAAQGLSIAGLEAFQRMKAARVGTAEPACTEEVDGTRVVFVVGESPLLPNSILEQFGLFGFRVLRVVDVGQIHNYMAGDAPCRAAVVLGPIAFFSTSPAALKEMGRIRGLYGQRLHVVLVDEEDDFQTRLRSVRYGADAFFAGVIEVAQLADKLDSLLDESDAAPYHILIVDDDPEQVSSTAHILQDAGMITSVVMDPAHVFEVLVEEKPELILMDMYMPNCNGIELAGVIRQNDGFVGIPIVFLSVERDEARQLQAIRTGADDFLTKPINPVHLVTSVRIRAGRTRAMRFFMERDSLTGLLNHTNLKQRLEQEVQRARRLRTELCFAMIDLDHFKSVNDTYGHLTGDRVLKSLARMLTERLRRSDIIGRYGGEEFGVILSNITAEQATRLMNDVRETFAQIRQTSGTREFNITFSCGIAHFPSLPSGSALSETADSALYRAKAEGRNRVVLGAR